MLTPDTLNRRKVTKLTAKMQNGSVICSCAICSEQATKLKICLDFIDEQEKRIAKLDSEVFRLAEPYSAALDFIRTVPGLSKEPLTAIRILSEIGADMFVFPTSKHLVS